jgi:cytochrome c oxidase assembly factor CtaG
MRAVIFLLICMRSVPALAHAGEHSAHGSTWTFDPWIITPLILTIVIYAVGMARLGSRVGIGRQARGRQALLHAGGWLTLAATLVSPFHWLGERLFTCHMIEHEIIMAVAAPLLAAGRPIGVLLWGLPKAARIGLPRMLRQKTLQSSWAWLVRPVNATILHGAAIWVWHVPVLFDAAVVDVTLHRLQHLSFLLTALLFWYSLLRTNRSGVAVWHLFVTMLHTSLLGALIAVAPRVLYGAQTADSLQWGLTALQDQQLAGIVMWIPAGTVYAGAALAFAARWIRGPALQG